MQSGSGRAKRSATKGRLTTQHRWNIAHLFLLILEGVCHTLSMLTHEVQKNVSIEVVIKILGDSPYTELTAST